MHFVVHRLPLILAIGTMLSAAPVSAGLSDEEQAMIRWIDDHSEESIDLLEEIVNIGSGTMNPDGIFRVGEVLRAELEGLGLATDWLEQPSALQRGNHLVGRHEGTRGKKILPSRV